MLRVQKMSYKIIIRKGFLPNLIIITNSELHQRYTFTRPLHSFGMLQHNCVIDGTVHMRMLA